VKGSGDRRYRGDLHGGRSALSGCWVTGVLVDAAVVGNGRCRIQAHLPRHAVDGEALVLLQVRRLVAVEIAAWFVRPLAISILLKRDISDV